MFSNKPGSVFAITLFATVMITAVSSQTFDLSKPLPNDPYSGMTSDLRQARLQVAEGVAPSLAMATLCSHAMRGDKLQVIVGLDEYTADVARVLREQGLEMVRRHDEGELTTITLQCESPAQLDALLTLPEVRGICPEPLNSASVGWVTAQSDTSINAVQARQTHGIDGTGVRIGVLSDSIASITSGEISGQVLRRNLWQNSGDLPAEIRVLSDMPAGTGSDEGNAMAQIIHDIAPGADMSFASASLGYFGFAQGITSLANDGQNACDVICDDVIYFAEPVYQDGPIAQAYNDAKDQGIVCFSSAGNMGNAAIEGLYLDKNPNIDETGDVYTTNDLHDFGAAAGMGSDTHLTMRFNDVGLLIAILHWDEPYDGILGAGPGSRSDLDMYLVSTTLPPSETNVVLASNSFQGTMNAPNGEPYEVISAILPPGFYHLVIDHWDGRDERNGLKFHLALRTQGDVDLLNDEYLGARTIYGHAAARGALAVGAVHYAEIDDPGSVIDPEPFSSLGGDLPILFDDQGNTIPGGITRFKPEICAPDGVNTTFFGNDSDDDGWPNFFGTSAASPHAAAVAALLMHRAENLGVSLTPQAIENYMRSYAREAGAPGPDFYAGDGLINVQDLAQSISGATLAEIIDDVLGRVPDQTVNADANGDGEEEISDAVYRVSHP